VIANNFDEVRQQLMEPKKSFLGLEGPKRVNKGGNPKGCTVQQRQDIFNIRLELNSFVPEVTKRMLQMIFDKGTEDRERIKCIELFFNRVYGKPTERVEIAAADNVEDMSAKQIEARMMAIVEALPVSNNKRVQFKSLTSKRKLDNAL